MSTPIVPDTKPELIADRVYVIPDQRVNLVPNVGFVVGEDAVLVVDTGMGIANAQRVLERARELADGRRLLLTLTHFHPEHGFGAQVFRNEATIVYNATQLEELEAKFTEFIEMFSGFAPEIAEILAPVELARPHVAYRGEADIDLGGKHVQLREVGPAHTRGDQVIFVPDEGVLFAGDLVENRFFPILPDADAHGSRWIDVLADLEAAAFNWARAWRRTTTVVPGHGEVGGAELLRDVRVLMETIRTRTTELAGSGSSVEHIQQQLEPEIREQYPDWDNPEWIAFAAANFHGELDGR
jgi:glyoxylase-like metal-dependent hydrolase (beta-lactamase superfamily II)